MPLYVLVVAADDAFNRGRATGRLVGIILTLILAVLVVGTIYWLSGRTRRPSITFGRAITTWWVLVVGGALGLFLVIAGLIGSASRSP